MSCLSHFHSLMHISISWSVLSALGSCVWCTYAFRCLLILQVLKETLLRHGFTFESETDTEVIPKLAKFIFDKANEEGKYIVTSSWLIGVHTSNSSQLVLLFPSAPLTMKSGNNMATHCCVPWVCNVCFKAHFSLGTSLNELLSRSLVICVDLPWGDYT